MAIAASSSPSRRVAMFRPVVPMRGASAWAKRSTSQSSAHTSTMQTIIAARCISPPACAAMMVVPIAPGPASSGTASGTTPESSPACSSSASAADWRTPPTRAFSIASAISSTSPPPTLKAGRLAPIRRSSASPKSAEPASTPNTVSVMTRASAIRSADERAAVMPTKIGTARNGSSTAVSVTAKRRYSPSGASSRTGAALLLRPRQHGLLRDLAVGANLGEGGSLSEHLEVGLDRELFEKIAPEGHLADHRDQREMHVGGAVGQRQLAAGDVRIELGARREAAHALREVALDLLLGLVGHFAAEEVFPVQAPGDELHVQLDVLDELAHLGFRERVRRVKRLLVVRVLEIFANHLRLGEHRAVDFHERHLAERRACQELVLLRWRAARVLRERHALLEQRDAHLVVVVADVEAAQLEHVFSYV